MPSYKPMFQGQLPPVPPPTLSLANLTSCSYRKQQCIDSVRFAPHKGRRTFAKPTNSLPLRRFAPNNNQTSSVSSSSSSSPCSVPRTKKTVSFATTATVNTRAMSQQELDSAWIRPEEYYNIEKDRRRTIEAVKAANGNMNLLDTNEICTTGLESQIAFEQTAKRRIKNMQFRKLIVEEMRFQKRCGFDDPEALQSLSEIFSQQAKKRAHLRAVLDTALQQL